MPFKQVEPELLGQKRPAVTDWNGRPVRHHRPELGSSAGNHGCLEREWTERTLKFE